MGPQRKCGMLLPEEVPGNVDKTNPCSLAIGIFFNFSFTINTVLYKITVGTRGSWKKALVPEEV